MQLRSLSRELRPSQTFSWSVGKHTQQGSAFKIQDALQARAQAVAVPRPDSHDCRASVGYTSEHHDHVSTCSPSTSTCAATPRTEREGGGDLKWAAASGWLESGRLSFGSTGPPGPWRLGWQSTDSPLPPGRLGPGLGRSNGIDSAGTVAVSSQVEETHLSLPRSAVFRSFWTLEFSLSSRSR